MRMSFGRGRTTAGERQPASAAAGAAATPFRIARRESRRAVSDKAANYLLLLAGWYATTPHDPRSDMVTRGEPRTTRLMSRPDSSGADGWVTWFNKANVGSGTVDGFWLLKLASDRLRGS